VECKNYNVPADKTANWDVTKYSEACHKWYAYPSTVTMIYRTSGSPANGYTRYGYTTIQDPCIDG
jgi:hypothetical protein